jgi:uncharacterized protein (DUF1800 family)
MRTQRRVHIIIFLFAALFLSASNTFSQSQMPYRKAGLSEREAAAHLLSRFTFGIRPDDIDKAIEMGLENWLETQLQGNLPDEALATRLKAFETNKLSGEEISEIYLNPGFLLNLAARDGVISRQDSSLSRREQLEIIAGYMQKNGYRPVRMLVGEMLAQKLLRAVYSENQMLEVLTEFWFNHFNVSITDNQCRPYVYAYERDAIRPNVLGDFRTLLGATAKHPAMLVYLDNAQSTAPDSTPTTMFVEAEKLRGQRGLRGAVNRFFVDRGMERYRREREQRMAELPGQFRPQHGINENYARELMELHTLGVDGGYTQKDVTEVARAFTGWSVMRPGPRGESMERRVERGRAVGFYRQGGFVFRADVHDATEKLILGVKFEAGRGMDEGEQVLDMLSKHPSTARFISRKLAIRFVSDAPPEALVDRLAQTFSKTNGDLRAMIRAIAYSKEFWPENNRRAKIKSPFELTVSALRALHADVQHPRQTIEWLERMGQNLYGYSAPTGYPDRANAWINTGSLLNRMNFGLNLALGSIRGVHFDLMALNHNREPESAEAALETYAGLLLPERDLSTVMSQLQTVIRDPDFARKVDGATKTEQPKSNRNRSEMAMENGMNDRMRMRLLQNFGGKIPEWAKPGRYNEPQPEAIAQVVGVILGSPAFQRR